MSDYQSLGLIDFDFIEFAVSDLDKASELYLRFGFERMATREIAERQLKSYLMAQNDTRVLLSNSVKKDDPVAQYVATHGDGVISVGFRCEDAVTAFETAVRRGASVAESPRSLKKDFGSIHFASIRSLGDVRFTFISREGQLFAEGFDVPVRANNPGFGLQCIDHITCNVEKGKMEEWAGFLEKVLGFKNTRFFDIRGERTGLYSKVMQSPDGRIKMPINEPTESSSQIQEFIDVHHGPGVQHIALATEDIFGSLRQVRRSGVKFLEVPATYYEVLGQRVPNVTEKLSELAELGVLVDGDSKGYLLQIFTHTVVGPFFYELIQRKGNDGFGEGNFTALFEAIERDQIKRGVLKA